MNITLDAKLSSSPVADTDRTTTYKTTADSLQVGNSGYSLDITDNKVMDDKAYQGHGLTAQDIMSKAAPFANWRRRRKNIQPDVGDRQQKDGRPDNGV